MLANLCPNICEIIICLLFMSAIHFYRQNAVCIVTTCIVMGVDNAVHIIFNNPINNLGYTSQKFFIDFTIFVCFLLYLIRTIVKINRVKIAVFIFEYIKPSYRQTNRLNTYFAQIFNVFFSNRNHTTNRFTIIKPFFYSRKFRSFIITSIFISFKTITDIVTNKHLLGKFNTCKREIACID